MTRGLIVALQFLTRLPTPGLRHVRDEDLALAAIWFPLVGALIGAIVATVLHAAAHVHLWLGALFAWVAWVWITGGLHLDGLADLADALGASHRDRARFLEVLRDPRIGTFGVLALVIASISRLVLLGIALQSSAAWWATLPLIAAWARFAAVVWSQWLPALGSGTAQRFSSANAGVRHWETQVDAPPLQRQARRLAATWGILLLAASAVFAPALLTAPAAIWAWGRYLQRKVGGVTGDCLGAGVEIVEIALLAAAVIAAHALPLSESL